MGGLESQYYASICRIGHLTQHLVTHLWEVCSHQDSYGRKCSLSLTANYFLLLCLGSYGRYQVPWPTS